MERSHFWFFVIIGLLSGVCLEIMKAPKPVDIRLAGFHKFETLLDEGRTVYGAETEQRLPTPKRVEIPESEQTQQIAMNDKPVDKPADKPVEAPSEGQVPKAPQPSPTPDPAALKKAEDAKKKAEEKKKKAEEKKKKDQEDADALAQSQAQLQADAETAAAAAAAEAATQRQLDQQQGGAFAKPEAQQGATAGGTVTTFTFRPSTTESASQWETILLASANPTETTKFVSAFKNGKMTSTTFYTVVQAMLGSSKVPIREQGEYALSQEPAAESFTLLDQTATKDTDPAVKSMAQQDIQAYAQVQNLKYLLKVVASSNMQAADDAIMLVQQSAATNLGSVSTTSTTGGAGAASNAAANAAANAQYFSPFLAPLAQVEQSSQNPATRQAASQTLTYLHSVLGTQVSSN